MTINTPGIVTTIATAGSAVWGGITVLDFGDIPAALDVRKCPQLVPVRFGPGQLERSTFGGVLSGWTGPQEIEWFLFHSPCGSNRNIPANIWPDLGAKTDAVKVGFTDVTYTLGTQLFSVVNGTWQTQEDAAGNLYFACPLTTRFIERK